MIVITGAAGFIGSALVAHLNEMGVMNAVLIDDFSTPMRYRNLAWKHFGEIVERSQMWQWLDNHANDIEIFIHLGAKSGYFHDNWYAEQKAFHENGQKIWGFCSDNNIRLIYAASGAVYESGELGFKDDLPTSLQLNPRHPYTQMRLQFDNWVLQQVKKPSHWAGLRMFNVYGPNEYHKMQNASMVYKSYNEVLSYGSLQLFQSHRPEVADGDMQRDFVYVKDVVKVISHFMNHDFESGLYNVGTGVTASFNQLGKKVFELLGIAPAIHYEPIPESIREHFPYFSCADISKLRYSGYHQPFTNLDDGITDYFKKYLFKGEFY
jgi:ADP-L-glycero-D-manno-heptose 6-epimerase